jgi:hypothetical protein
MVYAPPSCWNTSTYRLRIFRFDAWDFGRPGGGPWGANLVPVGVLGADSGVGTRFDRTRIMVRLGGDVLKSMADAERGGGGPASDAPVGL